MHLQESDDDDLSRGRPASDDSLNSQLTTLNFSACHRRRVNEREQHQNEIERVRPQRTIMLRPLSSDKRSQLSGSNVL